MALEIGTSIAPTYFVETSIVNCDIPDKVLRPLVGEEDATCEDSTYTDFPVRVSPCLGYCWDSGCDHYQRV